MKRFRSFSSIVCLILTTPALAETTLPELAGQGIPRVSEEKCQSAGKAIEEKLTEQGFENIRISCGNMTSDLGQHVPLFNANHERSYKSELQIGARKPTLQECKNDLAQLAFGLTDNELLEAECIKAKEVNYLGKETKFYQAWVTKLIPQDNRSENTVLRSTLQELQKFSHPSNNIVHDFRGTKTVEANGTQTNGIHAPAKKSLSPK